jgi:hypothetical protein
MSGGTTGIGPLTERGHSIGGAGRWLRPLSSIMLILQSEFIMKDLLLCCDEY